MYPARSRDCTELWLTISGDVPTRSVQSCDLEDITGIDDQAGRISTRECSVGVLVIAHFVYDLMD